MTLVQRLGTIATFVLVSAAGCGEMNDMPKPPSDLKVSESQGGAHLTWKDNSDNEGGFMIDRKVGPAAFTTYKSVDFNTTQYHDTDVAVGMTYTYRVMAMPKSGGHSSDAKYSNEVTFSLPNSGTGHDAGVGGGRDAALGGASPDAGVDHPPGHR